MTITEEKTKELTVMIAVANARLVSNRIAALTPETQVV